MSTAQFLARWIIQRAARKLPKAERILAEAEWLGHLEELPKFHLQLRHLVGVWRCAQMTALHSAWIGTTRSKVQECLLYALWMVSCMALITDYIVGSSLNEVAPHLLGAVFFCGPALKFIFRPLEEQKLDQTRTPDPESGSP